MIWAKTKAEVAQYNTFRTAYVETLINEILTSYKEDCVPWV
jgi:hypothetical protein